MWIIAKNVEDTQRKGGKIKRERREQRKNGDKIAAVRKCVDNIQKHFSEEKNS